MPRYCFICDCGAAAEVSRPMKDSDLPLHCDKCGLVMLRDYPAEHGAVRGDYDEPIESSSLAFDSRDVAEHRQRHPGVELKIEGHTAYPVLKNLSQKRAYLKARGWQDYNAYF